jgi:hypothetical protein
MPSPGSESPDDSFFNDLSQTADETEARPSPQRTQSQEAQRDENAAKQKRIACVLCRKRKLRCDGTRPSCGTCKRLSHDCAYDEVRKKSGPKRGYVKLLEQRLRELVPTGLIWVGLCADMSCAEQVETLLKNQEPVEPTADTSRHNSTSSYVANTLKQTAGDYANVSDNIPSTFPNVRTPATAAYQNGTANNDSEGECSWEMIGLGLEEPLPPPDVMEDLCVHHMVTFTTQLTCKQISNLLFEDPPVTTHRPPATVHGSFKPRSAHATACVAALQHVDHGSVCF